MLLRPGIIKSTLCEEIKHKRKKVEEEARTVENVSPVF